MYSFVNSTLGWVHLASAVAAMAAGAIVLAGAKGTILHKRFGYLYIFAMIVVNATAFGIYNLTGKFGVFHILAIISLLTIAAGMIPLLLPGFSRRQKSVHLWFMYYSILGLYAAFASELSVRIPARPFFEMVGIATGLIMIVGTVFILRKEKVWTKYFIPPAN